MARTRSDTSAGPRKGLISAAISGAKIALDIAKESADALGPLKSVLGGIAAILKHCEVRQPFCVLVLTSDRVCLQQTTAVRNQIQVLLSRIATLETIFSSPTDDREEQNRRGDSLRLNYFFLLLSTKLTTAKNFKGDRGETAITS